MNEELTAVVDLGALQHNLRSIRERAGMEQEVILCLKADAYGHGAEAVARYLEGEKVRWFSVATAAQALALRRSGITARILLFPVVGEQPTRQLCESKITLSIQSFQDAAMVAREAVSATSVFLKIDCGLGRLGASTADALEIARKIISELPSIRLEGVFTHLPFSSLNAIPWAQAGLRKFGDLVADIRAVVKGPLLAQSLASSGVFCGLEAPGANAVSPGQLLFGLPPAPTSVGANGGAPFYSRPVLKELSTLLGASRELPAGTRYGFGGGLVTGRRTRLAVIPAGFSNSILLPRDGQLANVQGQNVPIVAVSLEHAVLDITDVPSACDGSRVVLLSRDPAHGLTLDEVAHRQDRMPVEVLISLSGRCTYRYLEADSDCTRSMSEFDGQKL